MNLQRSSHAFSLVALLASVALACGCAPSPRQDPLGEDSTPVVSADSQRGRPRVATTTTRPRAVTTTTRPRAVTTTTRPRAVTTTAPSPTTTAPAGTVRGGYEATVYYTAVESFHTDAPTSVKGCMVRECAHGNAQLGSYPASFVRAVRGEGTGRITSGPHAGRYLNWSYDVGYWLDDVAVDSFGGSLVPFSSSAGDDLPRGFRFRLQAPLIDDSGEPVDTAVASRLLAATWTISDEFTPGLGGPRHVDLYIGEEDRPSFESTSPMYLTLSGASLVAQ